MMWLLAGLCVCAAIVVAGRRHSKHLDELDREWLELGDQRKAAQLESELALNRSQIHKSREP